MLKSLSKSIISIPCSWVNSLAHAGSWFCCIFGSAFVALVLTSFSIRCQLPTKNWCYWCQYIADIFCAIDWQLDAHCCYCSSEYEDLKSLDFVFFYCRYIESFLMSTGTEILSGWRSSRSLIVLVCFWVENSSCLPFVIQSSGSSLRHLDGVLSDETHCNCRPDILFLCDRIFPEAVYAPIVMISLLLAVSWGLSQLFSAAAKLLISRTE